MDSNIKNRIKAAGGLALMAPLALSQFATPAQAAKKPNIVFFLVDDYGWVDSQVPYDGREYPNHSRFYTPNMVRMAEMGVRFSHAYACPVSTPTRTSMMTGMNAVHSHITNWTSMAKNEPSDAVGGTNGAMTYDQIAASTGMDRPEWNYNGICPERFRPDSADLGLNHIQFASPMVQFLRDAGYYTIHVGKAHWASAGTPGASPLNMGFVINIAGSSAGLPKSYLSEDNYGNTPEKWNLSAVQNLYEYYGTGTFLTEAITREALKALEWPVEHKQPFYLYLSHFATHTPIQKDKRFFRRFKEMGQDDGQSKYASMVEGVDKSLGDVLDYLEANGLTDNTIIIFMADNGGNADVKSKGGVPHTQNAPLREGKGSCYEGGIRVPMSVYWPGKTKAGSIIDAPVMPEDLFPTILEMAGIKRYSTLQDIDGRSLVPLLKGKQTDWERDIIFHYPHQWKPEYRREVDFLSTIIRDEWKLVYVMKERKLELYNLKEDIGETRDLAADYPAKVRELAHALSERLRAWDASMPIDRTTGEKVPMPDEILETI